MARPDALHQALALAATPLLAGAMREQPLPDDVLSLIRIAAGDEPALVRATLDARVPAATVREAAALYVQHVMFAPNADHYRTLGVARDAPQPELREHVGWLMKWLHPDRVKSQWESVFAQRVVAAWNALKTSERRAAYDAAQPVRRSERTPSGRRRAVVRATRGAPLIARVSGVPPPRASRIAAYILAGAIAATVILATRSDLPPAARSGDSSTALNGGF